MKKHLGKLACIALAALCAGIASLASAGEQYAPQAEKTVIPYPDPGIKALDPSFKYAFYSAEVERIAHGFRWAEGPVWIGDGRYLLWSDIPNNQVLRWDEETGKTSVFRKPSNYSNAMTRDIHGRLVSCEHDSRRVTRTEYDGSITVLADSFGGKRLNSPNDLAVTSDNSVWFTDPPFGISGHYEGTKSPSEQPHQGVYRIDGATGELTLAVADLNGPNGIAFSPDEKIMYVVEARAVPNRLIIAYDVSEDKKTVTNRRTFIDCGDGSADGFKVDVDGNLWCGWASSTNDPAKNGVAVFNPEGKMIGFIRTPERVANLVFGGAKRNRLFMTGSKSIYSLFTDAVGAAPKFAK